MVIQGVNSGGDAESARLAVAEVKIAQDALDQQGSELRAALDALHAKQEAFEKSVKNHSRSLRALPVGHPALLGLRHRLSAISRLTPAPGGVFVQLFLGSLNVRFVRKSERLAFKADYERLKQRLAPVFVVVCLICLYFEENRWLHMLLQLALATYYVCLAIRENILLANGSNIKSWWITHHYLTMLTGVLLLTWPNNETYARFRNGLHLYGLYNAVLQIFQTRYQIARLYTLRSLGMAGEMDVSNSDSTQIHWSETMKLLLPLIVFGQFLQLWQGISLLRIYASSAHELQILMLGLLFLVLFVGNLMTTSLVVFEKRKASPIATQAQPGFRPRPGSAMHPTSVPAIQPHQKSQSQSKSKASGSHPEPKREKNVTAVDPSLDQSQKTVTESTAPSASLPPPPPPPVPYSTGNLESSMKIPPRQTQPPPPPPPPPFRPIIQ